MLVKGSLLLAFAGFRVGEVAVFLAGEVSVSVRLMSVRSLCTSDCLRGEGDLSGSTHFFFSLEKVKGWMS